ncbi:PQQ-dependent sugar dehydrogenase [Vibrio lamellibrachiae]|uniref:PQQ-dependent sugar dehydrogenase n=1 Tax=Vibrio lamellibrachiae TaxID=2910253 RepID=UPI003D10CC53
MNNIQRVGVIIFLMLASTNVYAWNVEKIASGFAIPWGLAYVDDNTMLITERNGAIRQVDLSTGKHHVVAEIPSVWAKGQGGIFDIALSPFDDNKIYVTYSKDVSGEGATTLALATYVNGTVSGWQDLLVSKSRTDTGRHFGSRIAFDDNSVYFSIGDRGDRDNGQNTQTHAGSILRLNPDGTVPSDNPYVDNHSVLNEIWSYGHRNPQGLFFDETSQKMWSIEHGPRGGDEINLIKKGANYGWPIVSFGKEYWGPIQVGEPIEKEGIEPPVKIYIPSIAPSSLVLYQGNKFPELKGKLLAGALKLTHINIVTIDEEGKAVAEERIMEKLGERIRDIEVSSKGDIFFSTDRGNLYRLIR